MGNPTEPTEDGRPADLAVLIVSPHLDDAVFSAWGLSSAHGDATLLTVLTGSPRPPISRSWDQHCGFADSDEAMAARLAEEKTAFLGTRHRVVHLGLLDAQYLSDPRAETDTAQLRAAVRTWLDEQVAPALIAVPVGAGVPYRPLDPPSRHSPVGRIGRQVLGRPGKRALQWLRSRHRQATIGLATRVVNTDHLWVRDSVVAEITSDSAVEIWFYEDYPYLLSRPGGDAAEELARGIGDLSPTTISVDTGAKSAAMAAYRSQLLSDPSIAEKDALPDRENYWVRSATRSEGT